MTRSSYSMEEIVEPSDTLKPRKNNQQYGSQDNLKNGIGSKDLSVSLTKDGSVRNLLAFWLFGLCNNFAYVIMLSAAHDILSSEEIEADKINNSTLNTTEAPDIPANKSVNETAIYLECNVIGTGAILLADILPTLIVKVTAPFYIDRMSYRLKVSLVVLFSLGSFIIVAFSHVISLSIAGVVCASISSGLGEPTFLGLSTYFDKNMVSTWSSGTGGAGVFGALSYAGLTSAGVSPRNTLLIMTVIPVLLALSYCFLLSSPQKRSHTDSKDSIIETDIREIVSWNKKAQLIKPLIKFMLPLMIVYLAEYFINQGLHELLYFNHIWLMPKEQYRWFQVDYQIGVFISRSSVNIFRINKLWILPALQVVVVAVLQTQVLLRYINTIWIIFGIILFEGLLGGSAYVNTFYKMSIEIEPEYLEYSLSVATVADTCGIALAGVIAIPVHNALCNLDIVM